MSGVLEWDPSADVGTTLNPTPPKKRQDRRQERAPVNVHEGVSPLERMALSVNPTKPQVLLRSQSEDNATAEVKPSQI